MSTDHKTALAEKHEGHPPGDTLKEGLLGPGPREADTLVAPKPDRKPDPVKPHIPKGPDTRGEDS